MNEQPRLELQRAIERQQARPTRRSFAPLAQAYRAAGELDTAIQLLEDGLQRDPQYVGGWVLLGECQRDRGLDEQAEATFARVLDLDADNLVALRFRALRAHRRGALDRAVDGLRRAMEIDPFDREVQADLGLVTAALDRQTRERSTAAPANDWLRAESPLPTDLPEAPPAVSAFEPLPPPPAPPPAAMPDAEWLPPWIEPRPAEAARPAPPPPPAAVEPPVWSRPPAAWPPLDLPDGSEEQATMAPRAFDDPFAPSGTERPLRTPPRDLGLDPESRETLPPPPIDLRRVGQTPVVPPAPEDAAATPAPAERPPWRFTRDDDRIVVAPADAPVRGPIRSVEDRLFAAQRGVPAWPEEAQAPPASGAGAEPVPDDRGVHEPSSAAAASGAAGRTEFATLTLAGIYESQGYLHKALAIYDELQRAHPENAEVAARLLRLQRRLAGVASPPTATPAVVPPLRPVTDPAARIAPPMSEATPTAAAEESVAWRLLDASTLADPNETAARLRRATSDARLRDESRRHGVPQPPQPPQPQPPSRPAQVQPPPPLAPAPSAAMPPAAANPAPPPPPPPAEGGRGHEDYERFLQYLRSLKS